MILVEKWRFFEHVLERTKLRTIPPLTTTSLLKKLSMSIKIVVIKHYGVCLVSLQIVDRIRQQSL